MGPLVSKGDEQLSSWYVGSCVVYIDSVIIYSRTKKETTEHLSQLLHALNHAKLKINIENSDVFNSRVYSLGRVLDRQTKTTIQDHVERISQLVERYNVDFLESFWFCWTLPCAHRESCHKDEFFYRSNEKRRSVQMV